jgi:N-acetylglucosamine-6-phosphate deacetylase
MLFIVAGTIHTPAQRLENGVVVVDGGRIQAVGTVESLPIPEGAVVIDASGGILVPGFLHLQLKGAFGHDFTLDPATIWPVAAGLPRYGVTSFLPTIITSPLETVGRAQDTLLAGSPAGFYGTQPLGLHLEGPYLNPAKKGAHNPAHMRKPVLDEVDRWRPQEGVRLVTVAPELPGALHFIEALSNRGVMVSAGHSMATLDEAREGIASGIRYGTHLFNAMPPLHHRDPGLAAALLTNDAITVGILPDGIHVHPAMVDLAWRLLGTRRLNLVSDAMAALGAAPGTYALGDHQVLVDATTARLADGTLAGSIIGLDAAVRNLVAFTGCSLAEALPTVTTTPAALLGMDNHKGQIAPGYDADLVLLDAELQVMMTIINGGVVYRRD